MARVSHPGTVKIKEKVVWKTSLAAKYVPDLVREWARLLGLRCGVAVPSKRVSRVRNTHVVEVAII